MRHAGAQQAMEQQMTAEREKRAAIQRLEDPQSPASLLAALKGLQEKG